MLESIKKKLVETEQLVFGASSADKTRLTNLEGGVSPEPETGRANSRANLMRYSTPNLILSSNFEHILRQQDRVSILSLRKLACLRVNE